VDQAAGSAGDALHGKGPVTSDYVVMVAGEGDLEGLKEKADKLLEAGNRSAASVKNDAPGGRSSLGADEKPGQQGNCRKLNLSSAL